ncbi:MAG: hypothetical protein HOW73_11795 [Polyangiaceae bacterium]|nr:hypothetical protein [Polyangiaceae bacterium]
MPKPPALPPDAFVSVRELEEAAKRRGPVDRFTLELLLAEVLAERLKKATEKR